MSIKKGLALLLAMTLGFTPVIVSAEELETDDGYGYEYFEEDEYANTVSDPNYDVHTLEFTRDLEDMAANVGEETEFSVEVKDTITATVSDPDTAEVPRNGGYVAEEGEDELTYTWVKDNEMLKGNTNSVKIRPDKMGTFTLQVFVEAKHPVPGKSKELISYEATITVKKKQIVTVADEFKKVVGDEAFDLEADSNGDGKLSYKSSDENIVTVTKHGLAKIKGAGTAIITVTASETEEYNKAEKEVKITVSEKKKKDQTIRALDQTAEVGDEPFELEAETSGDGALSFNSDNTKVVTIGARSGLVKVVGTGTANITITAAETEKYNKATKTVKITVVPKRDKIDISGAKVTDIKTRTYTGKKLKQDPTVKLNGKKLVRGTDYKIVYQGNRINAGKATFLVKGMGSYSGSIKKSFTIKKAKNTLQAKGKKVYIDAEDIEEKSKTLAASKLFKVSKNKGKVTYKKVKGLKKIKVASNGKVTLKPGIEEGSYSVKVNITAAGDKNHNKLTKSVTFTVVVK